MPLYYYACTSCDLVTEHLVDVDDQQKPQICGCGGLSNYLPQLLRFRHVGPVFADMMEIEDKLLTSKQKRQGMRLRDGRDVKKWERDNKLTVCTEQEVREGREYSMDMASKQKKALAEGGNDAWADEVDRMDITSTTGWSDSQYQRWKTMTDTKQKEVIEDGDTK
tara:strand:+ start:9121 stop:9615 length:495 start_codon:yes stop_codon:yes gene_type:complete